MDVHLRLDADADGPIVVKSVAPAAADRLRAEGARLARAVHPGVVAVVPPPDGTAPAPHELRTRYAGEPVAGWAGSLAGIAGLGAAVAVTLADLHATGFVHGRIDASHVLLGEDGRPRLCGLSPPPPGATAADDVAALARVLAELVAREQPADGRGHPGRGRGRRRAWGWPRRGASERRAFLLVLDRAMDPIPSRRPTARRFADQLLAAVPDADLPTPRPRPRRPPAGSPGPAVEGRPRPRRTWLGDRIPPPPTPPATATAVTGAAARTLLAPWLAPLKPVATAAWPADALAAMAGQPAPRRPDLVQAPASRAEAQGSPAAPSEPSHAPPHHADTPPPPHDTGALTAPAHGHTTPPDAPHPPANPVAKPTGAQPPREPASPIPVAVGDDHNLPWPASPPFVPLVPPPVDRPRPVAPAATADTGPGPARPSPRPPVGDRDRPPTVPSPHADGPPESPPLLPLTAGPAGARQPVAAPSPPAGLDPGPPLPGSPAPLAWRPAATEDDLLTRERPPPVASSPTGEHRTPRRRRGRIPIFAAGGAVAVLAAVLAALGAGLVGPGGVAAVPRSATRHRHDAGCAGPEPAALRIDVDGDGCPEHVVIYGVTVTAGTARWTVGRPGDQLAVGDWDCRGGATPAVLRPATGDVFVFGSWAAVDTPVTVAPVGRVPGGVAIRRAAGAHGCDRLQVDLAGGTSTTVEVPR